MARSWASLPELRVEPPAFFLESCAQNSCALSYGRLNTIIAVHALQIGGLPRTFAST